MVDPIAPDDIARRIFDTVRRGYEQQQVRGFLHEVSSLVDRLMRSEAELRERVQRAEARLGAVDHPDEATLLEALGAETTRVLTSAHEAAAEIRSKAEAAAERVISEATTSAAEVRSGALQEADARLAAANAESEALLEAARTELERRSAEAEEVAARIRAAGEEQAEAARAEGRAELAAARAEGEAALEAARQQGREMVAEAQAVRERVLRDLAVRRKRARQQVEKLNAGRERLLEAYDVVRRTLDEATTELKVSLTDARIAADAAARRVEGESDITLEELEAEVAAAALVDLPLVGLDDDHDDHDDHEGSGPLSGEVPVIGSDAAPEAPAELDDDQAHAAPVATEDLPYLAASVSLDDRRARKGRRKKGFEGLPPGELTVLEPPDPDEGVRLLGEPASAEEAAAGAAPDEGASTLAEPEPVADAEPEPEPAVGAAAEPEVAAAAEPEAADALEPEPPDEAETAVEPEPAAAAEHEAVDGEAAVGDAAADDVFARLRAQQVDAEPVADEGESGAADESAPTDESPVDAPPPEAEGGPVEQPAQHAAFAARAAAVGPIEKDLGRRLKRALADEQNEVLDLLRRAKPKGVDDLLPDADAHAARWADVAAPAIADAATAGAATHGGSATSTADLADELARALTAPLRERIDRSFAASDGNLDDVADRVRALYREWKGPRLTETTQHFAAAAFARGVFDGVSAGAEVCWVLDPSVAACPDCDDNVLAGAIAKGEEFPTGHPCAPAHPGCHCLVLAASD